ncbi:hypothetical protein BLNAU_2563 [Blattamonas nauphoetae]|uniref:non-specific serine/threonine protein kinase n=1 Tax=Blattamonas nauphoetae TaxID=2049346 RepID=A0ABQ9YEX6_9EUKA|nr:hypothetical protein BLNAU_2563 [Blattamonas nauphoetae]
MTKISSIPKEESLFITTDVLENETLRTHLNDLEAEKSPLKEDYLTLMTLELFEAVDFLHREGIILGNLDPTTIFLTHDRHIRISQYYCHFLDLPFTPNNSFAAPEILTGDKPSKASDMYSLGLIIVLLLQSAVPNRMESLDPHTIPPYFGGTCREMLERMISPDPTQRPNTEDAWDEFYWHFEATALSGLFDPNNCVNCSRLITEAPTPETYFTDHPIPSFADVQKAMEPFLQSYYRFAFCADAMCVRDGRLFVFGNRSSVYPFKLIYLNDPAPKATSQLIQEMVNNYYHMQKFLLSQNLPLFCPSVEDLVCQGSSNIVYTSVSIAHHIASAKIATNVTHDQVMDHLTVLIRILLYPEQDPQYVILSEGEEFIQPMWGEFIERILRKQLKLDSLPDEVILTNGNTFVPVTSPRPSVSPLHLRELLQHGSQRTLHPHIISHTLHFNLSSTPCFVPYVSREIIPALAKRIEEDPDIDNTFRADLIALFLEFMNHNRLFLNELDQLPQTFLASIFECPPLNMDWYPVMFYNIFATLFGSSWIVAQFQTNLPKLLVRCFEKAPENQLNSCLSLLYYIIIDQERITVPEQEGENPEDLVHMSHKDYEAWQQLGLITVFLDRFDSVRHPLAKMQLAILTATLQLGIRSQQMRILSYLEWLVDNSVYYSHRAAFLLSHHYRLDVQTEMLTFIHSPTHNRCIKLGGMFHHASKQCAARVLSEHLEAITNLTIENKIDLPLRKLIWALVERIIGTRDEKSPRDTIDLLGKWLFSEIQNSFCAEDPMLFSLFGSIVSNGGANYLLSHTRGNLGKWIAAGLNSKNYQTKHNCTDSIYNIGAGHYISGTRDSPTLDFTLFLDEHIVPALFMEIRKRRSRASTVSSIRGLFSCYKSVLVPDSPFFSFLLETIPSLLTFPSTEMRGFVWGFECLRVMPGNAWISATSGWLSFFNALLVKYGQNKHLPLAKALQGQLNQVSTSPNSDVRRLGDNFLTVDSSGLVAKGNVCLEIAEHMVFSYRRIF